MTRRWEPGCYGDGAFGHQHTRERCADILRSEVSRAGTLNLNRRLLSALTGEMSDDAWEERDAVEILNALAWVDGHSWGWRDGDFGLWPCEECDFSPSGVCGDHDESERCVIQGSWGPDESEEE
jgi:hypothetical protein